jgi:DNA-binding beta-propeller fold protein YncE
VRALCLACLVLVVAPASASVRGGQPVALVTAEKENALLVVALDGTVIRRIALPAGPQNVDAPGSGGGTFVVASPAAGAVTLLDERTLRVVKILRGFGAPHLAAVAPGGRWAYVTDDPRGLLVVIDLARRRVVRRVDVGAGAHHLTVSPDGSRIWVALGERTRTIVVLDSSRPARPVVVGRFDPGFGAHDVVFAQDGRRVWVTADDRADLTVFDAATRKRLFTVPAAAPPQHVLFAHGRAYVTSGNASLLEVVDPTHGRVLSSVRVPYGSFNLAAGGGYVLVSSLFRGTLTELDERGRVLRTLHVAGATRDVAFDVLP